MSATLSYTAGHQAHAASSRPAAWRANEVAVSVPAGHCATTKPFGMTYGVLPVNFRTTAIPGPLEASP